MILVYFVLILIQLLFGFNFVTSKIVLKHLSPFNFTFLRFVFSGVIFWLILVVKDRKIVFPDKKIFLKLIILANFGFALGQLLFLWGLQKTSAANTAIISTTIPLWVLIISILRKQTILSWNKMLGFTLAFLGVLSLQNIEAYTLNNEMLVGDILVFAGCALTGIFINYSRDIFKEFHYTWGTAYLFLFGSVILGITSFLIHEPIEIIYTQSFLIPFFYSTFIATLLTYFLNNYALTKVSADIVGFFIFLQPVFASIISWIIFKEMISVKGLIAICFIFIGMLLTLFKKE